MEFNPREPCPVQGKVRKMGQETDKLFASTSFFLGVFPLMPRRAHWRRGVGFGNVVEAAGFVCLALNLSFLEIG